MVQIVIDEVAIMTTRWERSYPVQNWTVGYSVNDGKKVASTVYVRPVVGEGAVNPVALIHNAWVFDLTAIRWLKIHMRIRAVGGISHQLNQKRL